MLAQIDPGGWDDVLPYFKKSEDHYAGATATHGAGGEWKVATQRLKWEILEGFQEAAKEFGYEPTPDFNSGTNEGSGFFEVNQRDGVRWNATKAFLRPVMKRENLRVVTNATTERVILDGRCATGVAYRARGQLTEVGAAREVLLCAGSINSPKILEQSGIGRGDILSEHGIEVAHESAGVGENLQDHLQIRTVFKVSNTKTLNERANSIIGKVTIAAQYAWNRSGPMSMAPSQFGMFTKSDPALETPDLEYHVQPLSTDKLGDPLHPFRAITVSVCNLRPESVGSCHIASRSINKQPDIRLNYLSAERDKQIAVTATKQTRMIMSAKRLERYEPNEFLPGHEISTDSEILKAVGNIASTIFHPVGTCKMGTDSMAVVDSELRVRGIARLRVVDASIMPKIVSGNTASPVIMIAENAADIMNSHFR